MPVYNILLLILSFISISSVGYLLVHQTKVDNVIDKTLEADCSSIIG